jgi:uncharacterized protein
MGKIALITGASAGIGKELARLHASKGGDLVLIARRKEKLKMLKAELEDKYRCNVFLIFKDLSKPNAPDEIVKEISAQKIEIDYLINNAGFSQQGYFHEIDWEIHHSMIMVNIMAMIRLTYLLLPGFVSREHGKILNIASSAAFAPGGPLQNIYYATKSFIVSFSQGLAGELTDTGITVTALCPGATETEFEVVSGLDKTNLFSMEKAYPASVVAKEGYEAMLKGELLKLTALTKVNKFVLKNMNLFPTKRILQQIKTRQEIAD